MSTQRLVLTGLLIIALLVPGASASMAEPAGGDTHQYTVNADGLVSDFGDPSVPIPPGTIYTNTLLLDDGIGPLFTRSVEVVVAAGPTPVASCSPTATRTPPPTVTPTDTVTPTPTSTPTATATPGPVQRYLPLILHR